MVFFIKPNDYQKMCNTNKNVTKMDMIIKGVYYIYSIHVGLMGDLECDHLSSNILLV
jgi:hypothetical protein